MGSADRSETESAPLGILPATFSYSQALEAGLSEWQLYQLRDQGIIEPVGRGLYRRHDADGADIDLIEVAHRAPSATLCLTTALARHGLTDEIPSRIDAALPRGRHRPATTAPVAWHWFDPATFEIGRTELQLDPDTSIGLYSAERSIIDAVRLRHREGPDLAYAALRRWLRRGNASPAKLLRMARQFPRAERPLREALEILL
ncbi:type IV toxin-antitoxin system AbiEi family antitoxin domain-containing protein [Micromonospora sp. NBC_00898]|uniref:type IV toxin-antitoxin system AbiEi family antitoxin domain-containing protein n=1 Tax=Micromonospora sp. NBC_00898 TaxID=2975981 RepID=UPI003868AE00|nr:type IV toxin-antitoxin system AbiEi family antitoxin domain-containing protein [Micromonospora sp. NBC_00898]